MVLMSIEPQRIKGAVFGGPTYPGGGERRLEASAQCEFFNHHFLNFMDAEKFIGCSRECVKYYLNTLIAIGLDIKGL